MVSARSRGRVAVWLVLATAACAPAASGGLRGASEGAGEGGFSRRDERQYIGSYADVRAVAVSRRYAYAATPSGVGVYDRIRGAWEAPFTRENGLVDAQITVIAGDPAEDAVWIGVPGAVVMYRPLTMSVLRTMIAGIPDVIAFDKSSTGDAYVRAGGQWTRVSRAGVASTVAHPPPPSTVVVPTTLSDLVMQFPSLRSPQMLLTRNQRADRALPHYAITSGASSPERASEVWLGTNGDGLYRVDPTFQEATSLRFGPMDSGIGALALAADGVWMAGLGESRIRGGLSFSSNDLQRWRWIDGTISVPLVGVRANALSVRAQRAWIATDRGVVRVRLDGGEAVTTWTVLDGLPDARVNAVAARGEGAWAGTSRGLVWVNDSTETRERRSRNIGVRLLEGTPVFALQPIGDSLWIGTATGLVVLSASGQLARVASPDLALRRPVRALTWSDSVLVVATDDGVLAVALNAAKEPVHLSTIDVRAVGQISRMAMDDRTIWLAGSNGVLVVARNGVATRLLRAPLDLPGPALDVVASRDWLWIATPFGLVRMRRSGDGGLP